MSVNLPVVGVKKKSPQIPYEQALGDSGEEKLPLNREKPLTEPGSGRGGLLSWPRGVQMFTDNLVVYKYDF